MIVTKFGEKIICKMFELESSWEKPTVGRQKLTACPKASGADLYFHA